MPIKKYNEEQYRAAIDRSTKRQLDQARKTGAELSHEQAKRNATERANRVQRKHEK